MAFDEKQYARLSPADRCLFNAELVRRRWDRIRRPEQIAGGGIETWITHLFRAGRGAGKTRSAAEWLLQDCLYHPGIYGGILAPTFDHGVQTCLFGESGIMSILPDDGLAKWHDKKKSLTFANGSRITVYSSEHVRQMRGPQFHRLWIDEPADLTDPSYCWEVARPAVRLIMPDESPSRIFITGTPKTIPLVQHLHNLAEESPERYVITTGATADNMQNLDPAMVEELYDRYKGSRYFEQEILGKLLEQAEGALWSLDLLSSCRIDGGMKDAEYDEVAIGVDPAVSTDKNADETGIIVAGRIGKNIYVTHDYSYKASALQWGRELMRIAERHGANTIVYERNLAGPLIEDVLKKALNEIGGRVRLQKVQARRTKSHRAEPVAALYEAGRVFHVHGLGRATLERLEGQMTTWEPTEKKSPDRIDATVHVINYLMKKTRGGAGYRASQIGKR